MSGCSDVTWTLSERPDTPRAMSRTFVWPSVSSTREKVFGVKPESLAVISYAPGASDGNRKNPPASLTALATPPCERFLASTVTPGITAPVLSFTVPSIEARCSWAAAGAAISHKPSSVARVRTRMKHPPANKTVVALRPTRSTDARDQLEGARDRKAQPFVDETARIRDQRWSSRFHTRGRCRDGV